MKKNQSVELERLEINMRVVLEGCDGVGKTTLAKLISDKYNIDICHCTQNDPTDFDFYFNTLRKNNIVWDRHVIGELVYPKIFNRESKLRFDEAKNIVDFGKSIGVKFFVLTSDENEIRFRIYNRDQYEDPTVIDRIFAINKSFIHYAKKLNVDIIDTSVLSISEIFNLLESK